MEKYVIHFYLLWGLIICTDLRLQLLHQHLLISYSQRGLVNGGKVMAAKVCMNELNFSCNMIFRILLE